MNRYIEDILDDCSLIILSLLGMLAIGLIAALMLYLPVIAVPQATLLYVVGGAIAIICMCGILLLGRYLAQGIRDIRADVTRYKTNRSI